MTRRHHDARAVLERVVTLVRLTDSVEQHLLAEQREQAEAAWGETVPDGDRTPRTDPPDQNTLPAVDYSDRTSRIALSRMFARYAQHDRQLTNALKNIDRALNDAERTYQRIIAGHTDTPIEPQPKCPGWNAELRAQLGGCGKQLETWKDAKGVDHIRSTYLCVSCRKASQRADDDSEAA